MKHIKIFENWLNNTKKPQVGDYVIVDSKSFKECNLEKYYYTMTHTGKLINIDPPSGKGFNPYEIIYEDEIWKPGDNVQKNERKLIYVTLEQIPFWSKNKEDLEPILKENKEKLDIEINSTKYNL